VAPLTEDHQSVLDGMQMLRARGGTAIGDGIALALDQLVAPSPGAAAGAASAAGAAPAKASVPSMIVLLTDGVSNAGIAPEDAAAQAAQAHIAVETIGVGTRGGNVFVLGQDVGGVDEQQLQGIAQTTGGRYFYAEAAGQLQNIFSSLGSQFGWRQEKVDLTVPVVLAGTLVLVVSAGLSMYWFRLLP